VLTTTRCLRNNTLKPIILVISACLLGNDAFYAKYAFRKVRFLLSRYYPKIDDFGCFPEFRHFHPATSLSSSLPEIDPCPSDQFQPIILKLDYGN
jgi:hypothetical protein